MDVLKAINFDLDIKALQQYYPSSNWRKAYEDINKFFLSNGFEHRQGSGYISLIKTDDYSVLTLTRKTLKVEYNIPHWGMKYTVA